jgi:hypothetical protein
MIGVRGTLVIISGAPSVIIDCSATAIDSPVSLAFSIMWVKNDMFFSSTTGFPLMPILLPYIPSELSISFI